MALGCVSSGNTPEPPALLARSLGDSLWVQRVPFRKCPRAGLPPFWEVPELDGSAAPNLLCQSLLRILEELTSFTSGACERAAGAADVGPAVSQGREFLPHGLLEVGEGHLQPACSPPTARPPAGAGRAGPVLRVSWSWAGASSPRLLWSRPALPSPFASTANCSPSSPPCSLLFLSCSV